VLTLGDTADYIASTGIAMGVLDTRSLTVTSANPAFAELLGRDLDGTIADYNRAIELYPKQPRAYMNRGFAKQAKGDVDGAIADYDRALELAAKLAKP